MQSSMITGADLELTMIDATIVRADALVTAGYGKDSVNQETLGRSEGGFTSKVQTLVDAVIPSNLFRLPGRGMI